MARGGARTSDDGRAVLAHLLFVASAAALFAIAVEIPHYANALGFDATPRARGHRFAVVWLLIAKSLLPLLPVQALALLGARLGFGRTTRRLLTAAAGVTRVRTDRPRLDAFAFVDDSGFPLLAPDPSLLADSEALAASLRRELTRLGGDEEAPAHANSR